MKKEINIETLQIVKGGDHDSVDNGGGSSDTAYA